MQGKNSSHAERRKVVHQQRRSPTAAFISNDVQSPTERGPTRRGLALLNARQPFAATGSLPAADQAGQFGPHGHQPPGVGGAIQVVIDLVADRSFDLGHFGP